MEVKESKRMNKRKVIIIVLLILFVAGLVFTVGKQTENNSKTEINNNYTHEDSFEQLTTSTDTTEVEAETEDIEEETTEVVEPTPDTSVNEEGFERINPNEAPDDVVDHVDRGTVAEINEQYLYRKNKSEVDTNVELPEAINELIIFNYVDEDTMKLVVGAITDYLNSQGEEVSDIEVSDHLSSIDYTDATVEILIVNGKYYKFVMTDTEIMITDNI